tara:strand:- start:966 stop:1310 length:345 start_codon:yes stop_codon:yes gene_type:complete
MKNILFALFILSLFSCSENNSQLMSVDVIDKTSFVRILEEVHLIEAEYQLTKINKKEKSANKLINDYTKLYSKFEITELQFENTMNYYSNHSEELEGIYEEVLINLKKRKSVLN